MSVFSPIVFKSSQPGAPVLSGSVGAILEVLSACLICNRLFTAVSGASFLDHTAEARSQGGAGFALFQGPTVDVDEAYVGISSTFGRAKLTFATPGVQNAAVTLAWEYWNGSAWAALSGVVDGTAGLTQDGVVTWTIPGDWVATSVNSVSQFYVRVRFTAGSWTTNPLVATLSVTGWSMAFGPTTNEAAYQQGGGNQFYVNVNDNGPGAGAAREARLTGFETMTALATGTGQFPTALQVAIGIGALVARKSATADGTARRWVLVADDRTFYLFVASEVAENAEGNYYAAMFGEFFSYVIGDSYRTMLVGRDIENSATLSNERLPLISNTLSAGVGGHYMARSYTGVGGSINVGKLGDVIALTSNNGWFNVGQGNLTFPNPPDGGLYMSLLQLHEATGPRRGRFRGLWCQYHPIASFVDGDTVTGTGTLAGRAFLVLKQNQSIPPQGFPTGTGVYVVETSDTWETN